MANKRRDDDWLLVQEIRLRNRLYRLFRKQMLWVVNNIPELSEQKTGVLAIVRKTNTYLSDVESMLDKLPFIEDIVNVIIKSKSTSMTRGGKTSVIDLGLSKYGISFDLKNPRVVKILEAKRTLELSDYKGNITSTTKERIKEILVKGADQGLSYNELGMLIKQQGIEGVFSQARGELISVTEIGRAYGEGQAVMVDDFLSRYPDQQIEKKWITAGDDKVRETHAQNAIDGWIPWHQAFSGTGEQFAPSQDIRCRCSYRTRIAQDTNRMHNMFQIKETVGEVKQDAYKLIETIEHMQKDISVETAMIDKIETTKAELIEQSSQMMKKAEDQIKLLKKEHIASENKLENKLVQTVIQIKTAFNKIISTLKGEVLNRITALDRKNIKEHDDIKTEVKLDMTILKENLRRLIKKNSATSDNVQAALPAALQPKLIVDKLESLKGSDRLDASAIQNIGKYASTLIKEVYGGGTNPVQREALDHEAANIDQLVNVCYGTGEPPDAETTTEGAIFIQYTA